MNLRSYLQASAINGLILLTGIAIGRSWHVQPVQAAQATTAVAADPWTQEPEFISPGFTVGSAGIGTLLVNRLSADQIVANGYDVLKLQEGILQLLRNKHVASFNESLAVAESAKVRLIRVKAIAPPAKGQENPK